MKKITAIAAAIPGWRALFFGEHHPHVVDIVGWVLKTDEDCPQNTEIVPCEFSAGTWVEIKNTLNFWKIIGTDDLLPADEEYLAAFTKYKERGNGAQVKAPEN